MLRGSYNATVDEKGRVKIPAAFKRILDDKYGRPDFYVTSVLGDCARLYPLSEWEEIEKELAKPPRMDPAKKKFLDRTNYYGQMQAVDGQGRILIHPLLRTGAELAGEVIVMGYLTYLEVWSSERFKTKLDDEPYTAADQEAIGHIV
jgi:MraZ protein